MSTGRSNPLKPQPLHTATPSSPASDETGLPDGHKSTPRALTLAVGRALGTVVVTVHGDLNATTSPQLAEVLRDLIDDQGNLSVVVDARHLTLSQPDGAAALVVAAHWAQRHGGTLAVAHASDPLRRALYDGGVREGVREGLRFTD